MTKHPTTRHAGEQCSANRLFVEDDPLPGSEFKILLSDGLWQQIFGDDSGAIGRSVRMNGRSYEVVGIMPAGLQFFVPEIRWWSPLAFSDRERSDESRHSNGYTNNRPAQNRESVSKRYRQRLTRSTGQTSSDSPN